MFSPHVVPSIKDTLSEKIEERVIRHKLRFVRIFYGRFLELLPSLIVYENDNSTSIDFLKVEYALRNNYHVVIGQAKNGEIMMLGYSKNTISSENIDNMFTAFPLTKEDIIFTIPSELIPDEMREISYLDNCETGNFVVLKNKTINYVSDFEIVQHYTDELSELVLSRYSITMQAKINTFFIGEPNDTDLDQVILGLYNGKPFTKTTKMFDPKDNIYTLENQFLSANLVELKKEYQNKISELNNMLGINSLAVEKASGVSDVEAKSNRAFTTSNANIYLMARNVPLDKLNKRFGKDLEGVYNDEVASEFSDIAYSEGGNSNEGNSENL